MQSALELAGRSDVVIMALGELSGMDFEYASRSSLSLPGRQQELLEKIQALGKPVVLLMFSTRPLDLSWASEHIPAIMDCSSEAQKPATRLQIFSWATRCQGANCPSHGPRIYYAHTASHKPYDSADFSSRYWDLPTSPLYSFGYGLSYPTFSISDFHLGAKTLPLNGSITATVTVANTGARAADKVVQLYLHQRFGSASRPVRELKGFRRITLQPGQNTKSASSSAARSETTGAARKTVGL
jgi:beta-glucosidase